MKIIRVIIPAIKEAIAPCFVALFQNNPPYSGARNVEEKNHHTYPP